MAKGKSIFEKAKEGIEEIGEKGGHAIKSVTGENHKKSRTHHSRGRKSTRSRK